MIAIRFRGRCRISSIWYVAGLDTYFVFALEVRFLQDFKNNCRICDILQQQEVLHTQSHPLVLVQRWTYSAIRECKSEPTVCIVVFLIPNLIRFQKFFNSKIRKYPKRSYGLKGPTFSITLLISQAHTSQGGETIGLRKIRIQSKLSETRQNPLRLYLWGCNHWPNVLFHVVIHTWPDSRRVG